jgi:membrane-bound metal-dependent hydrolase YbcI (DUF457 family)
MMVGHAMLAFALATAVAARRWPRERALAFGVVAAAFATVPDVDMVYALFGLAQAGFGGVWEMTDTFWGSSTLVHRAVTHSLVVGSIAAVAFTTSITGRGKPVAALLLAGLTAVAFLRSGLLGGAVMLAFLFAGVAVAVLTTKTTDLGPRAVLAAALLGLLSHPFGDLFTGEPPKFLYPFDVRLLTERVVLLGDPTLNLLAVFGVELTTIWLAGFVYLRVTDKRVFSHVDARAAVGVAYAIAVVAMPAPTMEVSYHFVFTILAVGIIGVVPHLLPSRSVLAAEWNEAVTWVMTGLGAVSVATLAYTLTYLVSPFP